MSVNLDLERALDWRELDEFLASARGGSFYHTSTWLRSLVTVYGYRLGFFTLREGGRLLGVLPFAESARLGFRQRQSLYGQDLVAGSVSQQDRRP